MKTQAVILFACLAFQLHKADAARRPFAFLYDGSRDGSRGGSRGAAPFVSKLIDTATQSRGINVEFPSDESRDTAPFVSKLIDTATQSRGINVDLPSGRRRGAASFVSKLIDAATQSRGMNVDLPTSRAFIEEVDEKAEEGVMIKAQNAAFVNADNGMLVKSEYGMANTENENINAENGALVKVPNGALVKVENEVKPDDEDEDEDEDTEIDYATDADWNRLRWRRFQINEGQFDFSVSLFKELEKEYSEKSYIFSPLSVYRVLLLSYMGLYLSNDATETLKESLGLGWASNETYLFKAFQMAEESKGDLGDGIEFETADKLYISVGTSVKPKARKMFANFIEKVDFSQSEARRAEINAWVEKITRSNIKDLIPFNAITPSTDLVVANAAFFKGIWAKKFDKADTRTELFNGVFNVEMMSIDTELYYGVLEEEKATFLELQYEDNQSISMIIYLPNKKSPTAVNEFLDKFTGETIKTALKTSMEYKVKVKLPKFSLESEFNELPKIFDDMGMKDLPFETIVHKAKLEIDENGSVAAAATAAVSSRGMGPMRAEFFCTRSFVLTIVNSNQKEVLFTAVYRGPSTPTQTTKAITY